jgi:vacuolar protein sorting-associated protein 13A/C
MFENLVLQVLTRLLGDYVEDGLDVNNLKVGIWSGKIELEKLKLRRDALDAFDLPLVVAHGFIGSVHVTVPWSNLKQEPVIVAITDVHIVVRPRSVVARDRDDARRRAADRKRARLALHDDAMLAAAAAVMSNNNSSAPPAADETFLSKLMTKILDNVQVQLDRVHLRFEDDASDPLHPFACGLTLQRVTAQSCSEAWLPAFVTAADASEPVRKRFELNSCAFYWSCDAAHQFLHRRAPADIGALLAASIARGDDAIDLRSSVPLQYPPVAPHDALRTDFILQPARATLRVLVNKSTGAADVPFNTLDFRVDSIDVALLDRQYRDVASLLDWLQRAPRRERYSLFRPLAIDASGRTPTPREQPRLWWQFAIAAVCFDVRERARKTRWNLSTKFLVDRGRKRRRYVQLYSLKLANQLETGVSAVPPAPPTAAAATSSTSASTSSTAATTAAVSVRNWPSCARLRTSCSTTTLCSVARWRARSPNRC